MIKINLAREGRAVRGAGGAPAGGGLPGVGGPSSLNNIVAIALSVLGVLAAAGYWFMVNSRKNDTAERLQQRETEAKKLDEAIKQVEEYQKRKDDLQKRVDLINQLKTNQKGPVRIMDQISRDLPDLVWLDTMTTTGNKMTLTGRALNPNAIALFVTNIKQDPYFEEPSVGQVQQMPGSGTTPTVYTFDMNFAFTYTPKPPGGAAGGAGATGTAGGTGTASGTSTAKAGT